jgi:hypothetical protein
MSDFAALYVSIAQFFLFAPCMGNKKILAGFTAGEENK